MARSVRKGGFSSGSNQSASTYPVSGFEPSQDGDPRGQILIITSALEAVQWVRFSSHCSTVRPSSFHLTQTSTAFSRPTASAVRAISSCGRSRRLELGAVITTVCQKQPMRSEPASGPARLRPRSYALDCAIPAPSGPTAYRVRQNKAAPLVSDNAEPGPEPAPETR